ncbi:MAG TPA: class I SAM-dependent methyltransferase [Coriobacteriia bacterium]
MKFDIAKIARLDDVGRFDDLDPGVMWEALGSPKPAAIVDIGAGTGMFARRFAALAPEATVFAVDTEQRMLDWIAEHPDPAIDDRLRLVLSKETVVPLPDDSAGLVVMINLHHELADPRATYREALRLLRAAGQLLVVDWARTEMQGGPPQHVRATSGEIVAMLEAVGFREAKAHEGLPKHSLVTAVKIVP